jgi:hypothetical protein
MPACGRPTIQFLASRSLTRLLLVFDRDSNHFVPPVLVKSESAELIRFKLQIILTFFTYTYLLLCNIASLQLDI